MKTIRSLLLFALLIGALLALAACDFDLGLDLGGLFPGATTAATTETPATTAPAATTAPVTTGAPVTTAPAVTTAPVTTRDTLAALAPYITLSREEYYGLSVSIPGKSTVSDSDVAQYIDALLAKAAEYKEITEGELRPKDAVQIFYRGEIEQDGGWVDFVGGSNLHTDAQRLILGSGSFIPGFEEGLCGLSVGETSLKLSTDASRVLGEDGLSVGYISCKLSYGGVMRGSFSDRVDLSAESGRYVGSALLEALRGQIVGDVLPDAYTLSFDVTGDLEPEEVTLSEVKLTHIVIEERTFCLNVTFPTSYPNSPALAGRTARFHVAVMKAERPVTPELTAALILDRFGVAPEQLAPFVPADSTLTAEEQIVAAFPFFIRAGLEAEREAEIREAVIMAFWRRMDAIAPKAYPEALLTAMLAEVREQLEMEYRDYASQYGSSLSLEEFVLAYYTLPEGVTDLDGFVSHYAKARVRQKMILHYIAAAEGWELTATERTEGYETYMQELIDWYRDYYGGMITVTKEDLIEIGYTEEYVFEQLLFEKVDTAIFETMREYIVFENQE